MKFNSEMNGWNECMKLLDEINGLNELING